MVSHYICNILDCKLAGRFYIERQSVGEVLSINIIHPLHCIHTVKFSLSKNVEGAPYSCVAAAYGAKVCRSKGICKTELLIFAGEVARLARKLHNTLAVEAVLRVVHIKGGNSGLVGVSGYAAVRNAYCNPVGTPVYILSLLVKLNALSYNLHNPNLVRVCNGETLAL